MGKKNKTRSWLIIIIGIVLAIITAGILFLYNWPKNVVNCIAIGGTFASLVGIAITMAQVSSVKKEVKEEISSIRSIHNVADFKGESKRVLQIQAAIPSDEYRFLVWQIGELKSFLVKQKSNPIVKNDSNKIGKIEQIIVDLGFDVRNLNEKIENLDYSLNKVLISKHIEDAGTLIDEVNGELENNAYDYK